MVTLYGIGNCDTCRKARKWLETNGVACRFHDLRADGLAPAQLDHWIAAAGWKPLLNTRSATWRGLPESARAGPDAGAARALMLEYPTLIKRPVAVSGGSVEVGFSASRYRELFAA